MPLSPAEEQELAQLQKTSQPAQSGLSPDEERELAQLQQSQRGFDDMGSEVSNAKEKANQQALPGRIGTGLLAGTGIATGGAGLMTSIPAVTAASLAKQKLQGQPLSMGQTAVDVGLNSVVPAGLSKLAKFLGIGADKAQQIAMGMKKYSPGAGTEAINQGVRGTVNTMQDKMAGALEGQGQELDSAVAKLKGSVDSSPVANRVADYGERYISPSGHSTEAGFDRANDAFSRASDINMRGEITPEDARSVAQAAEKAEGYSAANAPKANYNAELARQEAQGYRDELRKMGREQNIPVDTSMTKMHQLLLGNKALNTPQTLNLNNPISSLSKQVLKETVARPEIMSYGAAGANALSKGLNASPAGPASLFQLLLNRQGEQ